MRSSILVLLLCTVAVQQPATRQITGPASPIPELQMPQQSTATVLGGEAHLGARTGSEKSSSTLCSLGRHREGGRRSVDISGANVFAESLDGQ